MASHLASLLNRDLEQLENGLLVETLYAKVHPKRTVLFYFSFVLLLFVCLFVSILMVYQC